MKLNNTGKELIKKYESFRNHPYLDLANIPTIGWGNTRYIDGQKVKLTDNPITLKEGNELHSYWLNHFSTGVKQLVKVKLNSNQFSACVSLAYNIGLENFRKSTLLKKINSNAPLSEIGIQWARWNKARVNGILKPVKGLTRRRNSEFWLYKSPI